MSPDCTDPVPPRPPDPTAVRAQLARMATSSDFDASPRSGEFLRFVVEETLAGRKTSISQHALATQVFGRSEDFDPTTDPIVRMQAGRVRRSLELYYLTSGDLDPVQITMPKGAYVPEFAWRSPAVGASVAGSSQETLPPSESWPTLLVSPLKNLTGRAEMDYVTHGLASDLAAEFSRYSAVHVFLSPDAVTTTSRTCSARFELSGSVAQHGEELKINLHLVEQATGQQLWARTCHCPEGPALGTDLQDLVQTAAAIILEEQGVISSTMMAALPRKPRPEADAYEAILRYHHFELTQAPQAFVDALTGLRLAVKSHPDCAMCWSCLARLGASHWALGMPGDPTPVEASIEAAQRGVRLDPSEPSGRLVLGYVQLVNDEIDQVRLEAEAALALTQGSLYWLDITGYLLTLSGDWDRGPVLIRRAIHANPYHRTTCHAALWLDAIRRDDPAAAIAAAREFAPTTNFWHPLMLAVALVSAHRIAEATEQTARVLALQPDFPARGRWLITRYIKFDPLVETVLAALADCGLRLTSEAAPVLDGPRLAAR